MRILMKVLLLDVPNAERQFMVRAMRMAAQRVSSAAIRHTHRLLALPCLDQLMTHGSVLRQQHTTGPGLRLQRPCLPADQH
jgi:hypothetical protein